MDPAEPYSVTRYREDVDRVLDRSRGRRQIAWVVGGSWHYIQARSTESSPHESRRDPSYAPNWSSEAAEHGPEALHARLAALDPVGAATIERRNVRRVVRALEVTLTLGRPFSEVGRDRGTPLPSS